ncbi:MAG TPA: hypothetical protein VJ746_13095 [Nitrospira sp.]|nr:hypothetical protein [Nitrospira sp.]
MMTWETPSYIEISMSSEIGGYQDDFEERTPVPGDTGRAALNQANGPRSGSEG